MQGDRDPRYEGKFGREKVLSILKRNMLVGGDQAIAAAILESSEQAVFQKGAAIIQQGDRGDDVYFLLSGSVEIRVKGKSRIIVRDAPVQVGEMAALNPSDGRSATVRAKGGDVTVLKLTAESFHQIGHRHPEFVQRALVEQNDRNKAWEEVGTEKSWVSLISLKVAASFFAVGALIILCTWIADIFSFKSALFVLFVSISILLLLGIFMSRTVFLYGCFTSTGTAAVAYITLPIAFKFDINRSWIKGTVESPPTIDLYALITLVILTLIFWWAARYSQRQDNA